MLMTTTTMTTTNYYIKKRIKYRSWLVMRSQNGWEYELGRHKFKLTALAHLYLCKLLANDN